MYEILSTFINFINKQAQLVHHKTYNQFEQCSSVRMYPVIKPKPEKNSFHIFAPNMMLTVPPPYVSA